MSRFSLPSLFGTHRDEQPLFQSLHDEVERVFDEFKAMTTRFDRPGAANGNNQLVPRMNIAETDDKFELTAELPGVEEKDIDVTVANNTLVLKAEKSAEHEEEKKDYRLFERSYGSYMRSVPLGFDVDEKDVNADFANGILTIAIKKPAEITSKSKKIKIGKAA